MMALQWFVNGVIFLKKANNQRSGCEIFCINFRFEPQLE